MKLRSKFTLTLLLTSLLSAAIVGGIAYWLLMRDFRQSVLEQAFNNFQTDVKSYLETYGTWENGERNEPFPRFVQRSRRMPGGDMLPPDVDILRRHNGQGMPPFLFLLLDSNGQVIKEGGGYKFGDTVSKTLLEQARPIIIHGKISVQAVPLGYPNLSEQDLTYLAAMRRALFAGFAVTGSLAVLFGLLFGRRMSATLVDLTGAIRAMQTKGATSQQVPVRTRDEIGLLAAAFNAMSTELAEAHAEMKELSIRDPLTHLYNRRHFVEQAEKQFDQAQRYDHPLSIMVGDLDHFKQINDNFSHAVGDEVLCRIGELLLQNTRNSDIVARHGGEEFVIVFIETPLDQAVVRCEGLRQVIESEPWDKIHEGLRVTMSMGISGGIDAENLEALLHDADLLLYQAKRNGRNRVESAGQEGLDIANEVC